MRYRIIARTENRKLTTDPRRRPFAATYQEPASCPASCPFKTAGGCYAGEGRTYNAWQRAAQAPDRTAAAFGREVLGALLSQGTPRPRLRLSVAGDLTPAALRAVRKAVLQARRLGVRPMVFGFTHAWRGLDPADAVIPGMLRVRASVDSPTEKREAERAGWSAALTLPADAAAGVHPTRLGRDWASRSNRPVLTCPQQTGEREDCASCMACLSGAHAIGFRIHGLGGKARQRREGIA